MVRRGISGTVELEHLKTEKDVFEDEIHTYRLTVVPSGKLKSTLREQVEFRKLKSRVVSIFKELSELGVETRVAHISTIEAQEGRHFDDDGNTVEREIEFVNEVRLFLVTTPETPPVEIAYYDRTTAMTELANAQEVAQ